MSRLEEYIELSRELLAELNVREREVAGFKQPVAIVGMACRFPGAAGLEAFWRLLESGADAVTEGRGASPGASAGRAGGEDADREAPIRWGGFIPGVEWFDAEFFRIAPVEARLLDPQQRLLLETSWEALEDAGIDARRLKGSRTGVYAGLCGNDYRQLLTATEDDASAYMPSGNSASTAIGRVAFTLGLEGPALAVDTSCSTSLVAVHQAVAGLRSGDADLALAGGVNVMLSPVVTEAFTAGGMLSPDGRCKAFDASANGYVRGEGCGVVVLKRLHDAEAAGDRIWGVIRGSAVNHDGASAGLTVPNGPAQERVIGAALSRAGLEPREVDYLEAHGTGTELGDPIEVRAAAAAYGAGRDPARPLLLGSVKTNIGHLEAAAGVAGLIKVLLSMAHGVIPRHLHFRNPNPRVEWERLPVRVVSEPAEWPSVEGRPPRAGVSSFGFSGTNAHVVVEGRGAAGGLPVAGPATPAPWPEALPEFRLSADDDDGRHSRGRRVRRLLALSGRTDDALRELAGRYLEWLDESAADSGDGRSDPVASGLLADVAWTAGTGRSHHARRAGLTFADGRELRGRLTALASGRAEAPAAAAEGPDGKPSGAAPKVAFLFTGQGSQWVGMGRELYRREPVFRAVLDRCERAVQALRGESLLDVMFGDAPRGDLDDTRWTQPALYALESGLAALWRSVGVVPSAVLGHSVGEIAAAHAAGVFSLEDGLRFAALRGESMGSLPAQGSMAAVFAPAAWVSRAVAEWNRGAEGRELSVAAYNGGHQVVSGAAAAVDALLERCGREGLRGERLQVRHAFHSALMEPVLDELEGLLAGVAVSPPAVDWVSNVTGRVVAAEEELAGVYWRRQAREPVAFSAGVAALAELGVTVLVEVGPRPVLGAMAALAWPSAAKDDADHGTGEPAPAPPVTLSSLGREAEGAGAASPGGGFLEAVALAYEAGLDVSFEGLFVGEERRRVSLPRYPFQRQRYWADPRRRSFEAGRGHALVGARHESAHGETTFETKLYATAPEWLSGHRVFGRVVAPAALYGAMASSAASLAAGAGSVGGGMVLEDARIHGPLVLPEGAGDGAEPGRRVQAVVGAAAGSGRRTVAIYSKGDGTGEWTLHLETRAAAEAPPAEAGPDPETSRRGLRQRETTEFYRALANAGMDFTGPFRAVRDLWCGPGEAVGEVSLAEGLEESGAAVHPVLLDGCFQVMGAALADPEDDGAYMPFGWERLWVKGGWPERVTCHARLREPGGDAGNAGSGEVVVADLWVYGAEGTVLGAVTGLVFKWATRAAFLAAAGGSAELLYTPVWRESAHVTAARGPAAVEEAPGLWVVALDEAGEGMALAEELAARNQRVVAVADEQGAGARAVAAPAVEEAPAGTGSGPGPGEAASPGVEVLRSAVTSRRGWRVLLERLTGEAGLRGAVHLAALAGHGNGAGAAEMAEDLERGTGSALAMVQGLLDAGVEPSVGTWLVTRGGQVVEGEAEGELSGAALWGMGKTLAWEAGQLKPRLVDLDPEDAGGFGGLVEELLHPDREREVAYRGGSRRVLRLARGGEGTESPAREVAGEKGSPDGSPAPFREDGTYLVTGGLGGIGMEVARWLAAGGARNVVLNGRREPGPEALAALEGMRARGVAVRVELADVTDGGAVAAMLERVERELPPLAGVFHSVGVLSDASVMNQDWARFERVLWPKVMGAWHLHRATAERELELFVLFTSVAGVLGNAGQANYTAANAFLDQLARHRRALGLAGQSIAWGAWSGVGEAEEQRDRIGERLAAVGVGWMTAQQGLGALDRVLRGGAATSVAALVDWRLYGERVKEPPPLLEDLVAAPVDGGPEPGLELLERLRGVRESAREGMLLEFVQRELQAVLQTPTLPAAGVGFFDLGMDSLMAVELRNRLNRGLGGVAALSSTVVFDHGSPAALARHLVQELGVLAGPETIPAAVRRGVAGADEGIAIVGLACRFPGGGGVEGFWRLLESGGDGVREGRENPPAGAYEGAGGEEPSIRWGGFVEGVELFDAEFFRIASVEAQLLDPQQRLLLETSWQALESAAIDAGALRGSRTGVYAGISTSDYRELLLRDEATSAYLTTGTSGATAIGRVAFTLGLEGPVLAVDTACSSSLVAVHQAVAGLQRGDADLALAGGVNVLLSAALTESVTNAGMLSPDGRCKTFDASANGYVRGEGCGVVVLKRLREAEADGDRIWGVIRGSAVNHDGASAGLTVPSGPAQERVIGAALAQAGLAPGEVDYLEAHGTGTELGDPIEVNAAAAAYGVGREADRPLLLGSAKTNVGHMEAAAGVGGLIKVVLSMAHGVIPKSLHFREPNPHVDWEALPVRVVSEQEEWPVREGSPARAGVSSFGFSGTNAHVVVEGHGEGGGLKGSGRAVTVGWPEAVSEHRPVEGGGGEGEDRGRRLLALSGRTEGAVRELSGRYVEWLEDRGPWTDEGVEEGDLPGRERLADMAWTAGVGRSHHGCRAAVTFGEVGELRGKLAELAAGGAALGVAQGSRAARESEEAPKVGFLFTGQGSQWTGMGRELYRREPVFRAVLDRCEAAVRELRGESLLGVTFGEEGVAGSLDDTRWTQPALYALEAGLTALWASVGVTPAAVLGHSVGEIAAAHAAGVVTLEEGVRFAARRGELMGNLPVSGARAGAMAAVFTTAEGVEELVAEVNAGRGGEEGLSVAAYNGAHQVVSGALGAVEALLERCEESGVRAARLRVSHGFHSALMEPVLEELEGLLEGVEAAASGVALVSNVTGRVLGSEELMDGVYWRRQAREPVAFGAGVAALSEMGVEVLVELGPGPVLGGMAALAWPAAGEGDVASSGPGSWGPAVVSSLARKAEDGGGGSYDGGFAEAEAAAYAAGLELSFAGMFVGEERRRVSLPGYPFQRQRYWPDGLRRGRRLGAADDALLGERRELPGGETELHASAPARGKDLLYEVKWREVAVEGTAASAPGRVLVVDGSDGQSPLADRLAGALAGCGVAVTRAPGREPAGLPAMVTPGAGDGNGAASEGSPGASDALAGIVLAAPSWRGQPDSLTEPLGWLLERVQGLAASALSLPLGVCVVTQCGVAAVAGEAVDPVAASLWGFGRSVQVEQPGLGLRLVDLEPAEGAGDPADPSDPSAESAELAAALVGACGEDQLAARGGGLLAPRLERMGEERAGPAAEGVGVSGEGSYLVTGGLGYLGLELAEWLAREGARHVVLVSRRAPDEETRARLDGLERETGCRLLTERADVGDGAEVSALLGRFGAPGEGAAANAEWPRLLGVFHAAGVVDAEAEVTEQTGARMAAVMRGKALGAWHLHRGTAERGLELFVLYSSVSSVWALPRQSGYAAANAFLDGLAALRRSLGLAGTSVCWGPWGGGGMGRGAEMESRMTRQGLGLLSAGIAHTGLEELLRRDRAAGVVLDADWGRVGAVLGEERPSLLSALVPEAGGLEARGSGLLERLRGTRPSERESLVLEFVQGELQELLGSSTPPAPEVGFFDLGVDSLMAVEFRSRVNRRLSGAHVLPSTAAFDYPTPAALARHLAEALGVADAAGAPARRLRLPRGDEGIAVVGMACRFPGGGGAAGFWRLLESGGDAVTGGRGSPLRGPGTAAVPDEGRSIGPGGFIEGVDLFDAEFFRIAPVEARLLDPQQRLLLETSWEALESAGMDAGGLRGSRTGVYAGISSHDYADVMAAAGAWDEVSLYLASGNSGATAIGRVAFTLGFEGPAVAVDTACSSSLVAVHQAVSGLQRGEADLALAAGVNVLLSPVPSEALRSGGALSPDGRCKTFDASADGYGRSEGCGVVVLKRLAEAEADGDRIWGVIRGTAVNHDGASAGLTVPNGPAQERVIGEALSRAGLAPGEVDYLEAHGTGTELGDPIEVGAAAAAYGAGRDAGRPLLLGSAKTNVGHLEAAAGVAGLIKVLLSMAHGVIPKHLHFREPTPHVDWERLPVRVVSEPEGWPSAGERPARAGVSSFGFSGTNAHVVVEEHGVATGEAGGLRQAGPAVPVGWPAGASEFPPAAAGVAGVRERRLLALSGRTQAALRELAGRYADWLEEHAPPPEAGGADSGLSESEWLADMAWTAGVGRSHHRHRAGVTFAAAAELRESLAALAAGGEAAGAALGAGAAAESGDGPKVGFLFTGQGSQWVGMGRDLYEREPVFRSVLDRCEAVVRDLRGESLAAVMFGDDGGAGSLDDTRWTQPALYALEAGLCALWASVGVRPWAVLGHSVGEIAAAHAAGVFSLEAGIRFAAQRGELMGSLPAAGAEAGAMAAVFAPAGYVEELVRELNGAGLSVAAYNGAHQVVSGLTGAVDELLARCESADVRAERLRVSHGFHSELMEPVLEELASRLSGVELAAPRVALVSNVTGEALGEGAALDGTYWRRQAREPVAFAAGVRALAKLGVDVLVELGPRPVLGTMAALAWPAADEEEGGAAAVSSGSGSGGPLVVSSLHRKSRNREDDGSGPPEGGFVEAVARAYASGLAVSFEGLFAGEERRRAPLPGYPFQRQRYWADAPRRRRTGGADHPLLGARRESASGETTFETVLYAAEPEWLSEHRVFGRVAAPGAMYGVMALSAASLLGGRSYDGAKGAGAVAEDVQIRVPLVLPEGEEGGEEPGRTVQVVVSAADGTRRRSVKIYSRGEDEGEWTLHAEARAGGGAALREAPAGLDLEALKEALSELDVAEFYRGVAAAGVELGGSFRTVQGLWCGPGEAVGDVRLGAGRKEGEVGLHPVLLDGCFQVVGAALSGTEEARAGAGEDGIIYLPLGWERLWVSGTLPDRVTCHARQRMDDGSGDGAPEEVLSADLGLYDENGERVGSVSGLVLKRATRAAFLSGADRPDDLLYAPVWRGAGSTGAPRPADRLLSPQAAASGAGSLGQHLEAEGLSAPAVSALLGDLERLSRGYAVAALDGLGWRRERGAEVAEEELRRRLKVVSEHAGLFGRVLALAADAGALEPVAGAAGRSWRVALGAGEGLPDAELGDPAALAGVLGPRHRSGATELAVLSRCGGALAEVLRGRVEPLGLLFDEAGPSAADLYRDAPAARAMNRLLSAAVAAAVSDLPGERRLRVLEVGAGTGGTTGAVLGVLPEGRLDYVYTDVSAGFFAGAAERFGTEHGLSYRVLDIERDPVDQGFSAHGYDVVIAGNVLHATRDLGETLGHCRRLLSPGGLLVALEGLGVQGWLDLTFGLLAGWWRFAEGGDGYRREYPLMGAGDWRRALADAGFVEAEVLGEAEGSQQGVIVARGPMEVEEPPGLWVLSSDDEGEGLALAEELAGRNQRVVLAVDEGASGVDAPAVPGVEVARLDMRSRGGWHRLLEGLPEETRLRGVVHLGTLSGHGCGGGAAELAVDVERGTGSALALAQGLVDAGSKPAGGTWLVTRGAQVVERERGGELSGSALWGLGKTLALEAGQLKPRLVDLDPDGEGGSGELVEELLYPDRETEVAYRGGSRRALRLARGGTRLALPEGADWRLVSGEDGLLESVRAERVPARALEPGELRVAVEAAGLNFLDVMAALRLVDVAASLGGEFCGRVLEVGADVTGFSSGDRVAGFAPGGLGPEAVTRAEWVVRAPAGMTPAELATVPVVFSTAVLAFELSGLKGGERVLVHAGAGGVGLAAIQLAQGLGAEVHATASAPKRRYLESLGVTHVFDSRSTRFGDDVMEATDGEGVDVVLNSLTGEGFIEASLSCLKEGGRFVEIAKRGIWSEDAMREARPDVDYHVLALDRLLEVEPERVGRVLRGVMERVEAAELRPLRHSVWGLGEAREAMEYMSSGRHVGKLVLRVSSGELREDGTYLVTGGLGGIGLELARWLADHGARSLVLNGRREPGEEASAAVEALRTRGVEVRVELADVTDGEAVAGMLERMDRGLPPLAGVFHSVGVLSDAALGNQDWNRFERVLWPKVLGAWHLHRATEERDLDLFVLFSSLTGVLGNAGQANHAAANAFLDQLARHRRALGLPGQSIAWGAWSGVGEAEEQRERIGERLAASGAGWMTLRQGLGALERVVRQGWTTSVAALADWGRYGERVKEPPPLLEELMAAAGSGGEGGSTPGLLERLREVRPSRREELLLGFVQAELQAVLQASSLPAPDVGFFDLGMDSLMAVEFRSRLNRGLAGAHVLSSTVVFNHASPATLARHLAEVLRVPGGLSTDRAATSVPVSDPEAEKVQGLSESDLFEEALRELGEDDGQVR